MSYGEAARQAAKQHVAEIRAATFCEGCGGQPIEWHSESHETRSNRRVAHLVALGFPLSVIDAEIAQCQALCRSCHMKLDGRLAALQAAKPRQKGRVFDPKPCIQCGKLAKPLRKGLCNRCNQARRYHLR